MEAVELYPEAQKMPIFWATLLAKEKIVINQGGTSSGKSHAIIRILFLLCILYKNIKVEVVAATVPKLVGDTLEIAEDLFRNNKFIKRFILKYIQNPHTFHFKNGSKLIFKSYQTAKDADGPKRDILYISEARNFDWPTVEQLMKRTKRKIFIDYNPVETFWAHDRLINCPIGPNGTKEYPSVKVIRSWHIHNNFISKENHEGIENIADREMWKAYARGLTATLSGMVYPGWDVINEFPLCEKVVWGLDLGYTNDPTALIKVGINPYYFDAAGVKVPMAYNYVFEELTYAPGITAGHLQKLLTDNGYNFGEPVYMDHDSTVQRELRGLRIVAVKAIKGKGCIQARVLHLRTSKCAYTRRSENIHEERRRYMFYVDKSGKITNEPVEGNDHAMNGCEYGAFSYAVFNGVVKGYSAEE